MFEKSMHSIKDNFFGFIKSLAKSKKGPAFGAEEKIKQLNLQALNVRLATLESIFEAGSGHSGTALSIVDIITALLFHRLNWESFLDDIKDKPADEQLRY